MYMLHIYFVQYYFTFARFLGPCSPNSMAADPYNGLTTVDNAGDEGAHVFCDALPLDGLVLEDVDIEVEGAGHRQRQVGHLHHHVKPQGPGPFLKRSAVKGEKSLVNIGNDPKNQMSKVKYLI